MLFTFQVALVYPNSDPLSFMCAFYGCVTAGVVPVPIEVPLTRRVSMCMFILVRVKRYFIKIIFILLTCFLL